MLKRVSFWVVVVCLAVSAFTSFYFVSTGQSLFYRDAKSHLNIARRVFFSETPGLAQLGGIWLPLPHVLMLATVWISPMYYSGISGTIPSVIGFVAMSLCVFLIIRMWTDDVWAALLGVLIVITNPSILYLQSTPMSEMILLGTSLMSIYYLSKWLKHREFLDLVVSGFYVFLATLTRYDGWFLLGCGAIVAFLWAKNKKRESSLVVFCTLGGLGIFLWMLYSKMIFGSFLNFALGKGSAAWDTNRVTASAASSAAAETVSKGNFIFSLKTYSLLSIENAGLIIFIATIFGLGLFLFKKYRPAFPVMFLLLSQFIFNVVSLFAGLSIAMSRLLPPYQTYNLRYGASFVPLAAFVLGMFASTGKIGKSLVVVLLLGQLYLFYSAPLPILADAQVGNIQAEQKLSEWIRLHPSDGRTLLATLAHDPILFDGRIPMQKLIYEGNAGTWDKALKTPYDYADRIIYKSSDKTNDTVSKTLGGTEVLENYYSISYTDGDYVVYDRNPR